MRASLALVLVVAGCTYDPAPIARLHIEIDVPDGSLDAAGDAAPDARARCPARMIDLGAFCIDVTEVTRAQYAAFLATKPMVAPRAECSWKLEYEPTVDPSRGCTAELVDLAKNGDHPVTCVDWCDAAAYCKWSGKRLCGAIGGGAEPFKEAIVMNDRTKSEWYAACAGDGPTARAYPYGDDYQPAACNDRAFVGDGGVGGTQPVGAAPTCHGAPGSPHAAVYDLSGNVYEWVDNCQAGLGDRALESCVARGGFFGHDPATDSAFLQCAFVEPFTVTQPRQHFDDHIGIRCCAP